MRAITNKVIFINAGLYATGILVINLILRNFLDISLGQVAVFGLAAFVFLFFFLKLAAPIFTDIYNSRRKTK
ncbi:hypothetical protein CR194_04110 [Salipaludibacillus keqinensis]|uniref:Uncharacterized protein n=1 Tax=Salipaludibacillus keqinensis TaxID=2045207 RepID=A0A323TLA3_9BACI|nr:hypothetical protein [Salipaludibacillus keqinensis]PYZ94724.1 hypothetical protein CR194_04110 [Salipaludibacillus keqinensis]